MCHTLIIEDEWFIVFLLLKLTENMPGLIARFVFFFLYFNFSFLFQWLNLKFAFL
jgi:hypothetical protein